MIMIHTGIQLAAYTLMSKFNKSLLLKKNIVYSETSEKRFVFIFMFAPCINSMKTLFIIPTDPLRGLSPRANYTDRAAAAGRRR